MFTTRKSFLFLGLLSTIYSSSIFSMNDDTSDKLCSQLENLSLSSKSSKSSTSFQQMAKNNFQFNAVISSITFYTRFECYSSGDDKKKYQVWNKFLNNLSTIFSEYPIKFCNKYIDTYKLLDKFSEKFIVLQTKYTNRSPNRNSGEYKKYFFHLNGIKQVLSTLRLAFEKLVNMLEHEILDTIKNINSCQSNQLAGINTSIKTFIDEYQAFQDKELENKLLSHYFLDRTVVYTRSNSVKKNGQFVKLKLLNKLQKLKNLFRQLQYILNSEIKVQENYRCVQKTLSELIEKIN